MNSTNRTGQNRIDCILKKDVEICSRVSPDIESNVMGKGKGKGKEVNNLE